VREADTVARIGGDEIAILLVGAAQADAESVLAKVVTANAASLQHDGVELRATVSVGAAGFPDDAKEGEALRKHADAAMYAAKAAGGNRYALYRR
jgi:diguanylate cyclase (GGDEF)-like protein